MKRSGFILVKTISAFGRLLLFTLALGSGFVGLAQTQQGEEPPGRHICPVQAIRNGTCDPNPGKGKSPSPAKPQVPVISNAKKQPQYKRVAKQPNTSAACNARVKATEVAKNSGGCDSPLQIARREDLPISSQRVGVTIWRIRELQSGYTGARILSHPDRRNTPLQYQAERLQGDPVLAYGEKVRLGVESPRDGYLYVFDRELYEDGSLSAAYLIFPTTRLRDGDNRIRAN